MPFKAGKRLHRGAAPARLHRAGDPPRLHAVPPGLAAQPRTTRRNHAARRFRMDYLSGRLFAGRERFPEGHRLERAPTSYKAVPAGSSQLRAREYRHRLSPAVVVTGGAQCCVRCQTAGPSSSASPLAQAALGALVHRCAAGRSPRTDPASATEATPGSSHREGPRRTPTRTPTGTGPRTSASVRY